jgi:Uncharacterized conserved protein
LILGIERDVQPFLTANWRYLAMLNYVVDPALIERLVPAGTEIDYENGETFVSIVGFLFLDTRLLGLPIPLHRDFEEVNLRFYVRRKSADTWRRGVVFVRELVPRRAIALVARAFLRRTLRRPPNETQHRARRWQLECRIFLATREEMGISQDERIRRTAINFCWVTR